MPSKIPSRRRAPRGSGQRTRTGCLTCKQRRVKCDEQKPLCRRCIDGGFECTGYAVTEPARCSRSRDASHAPEITTFAARSMSVAPVPGIQWTANESRSISFVVQNLIPGLVDDFESPFWERHVLQLGHSDAAVKHALAALGAVHETRDLAFLRRHGDGPGAEELASRQFALQQYNHSIQILGKRMQPPNTQAVRAALVCCLIFVTLELLQRNPDQALKHLRAGSKIYRTRMPTVAAARAVDLARSSEDGIGELFYRLDSQATGYMDSRRPLIVSSQTAHAARSPSPASGNDSTARSTDIAAKVAFTSSPEIGSPGSLRLLRAQIDDLHKQALVYLIENQMYRNLPRKRVPADIVAHHLNLLQELTALGETLDATAAQIPPTSSLVLLQGIQKLIVSQRAIYAMARRHHVDIPQADYDADYQAIIDAAEPLLLDPATSDGLFGEFLALPPSFTLDASLIPSLFMTAHGAPSLETRERATKLLRRANVQEGLWSSDTLAEIAEKCLQDEIGRMSPARAESLPQLSSRLGVDETGGFEPLTSFEVTT